MTRACFTMAVFALAVFSLAHPGIVAADEISDARAAFERGVALLDDERFLDAANEFERSVDHHPTAGAHYNLGLALRGTGRITAAIDAFEQVLSRYATLDPALRTNARTLRDELRARVARLTLTVTGEPDVVLLDDAPLEPGTTELILDPGSHVVTTRREGFDDQRAQVELAPAEASALTLDAAASPRFAQVDVAVAPDRASVTVDDEPRGEGTMTLHLSPGVHQLRIAAEGFDAEERRVVLRLGEVERLSFELHTATDLASDPWFWVVLGTVAAAVAFGVGIGLHFFTQDTTQVRYIGGTFDRVFLHLSATP